MITTLQLGAHLLRYFEGITSLHDLPPPETQALVDAINLGLGEFLSHLPAHRLITPASWRLPAPVNVPISIVAGATGFSYTDSSAFHLGGYASADAAIGHSVTVGGDAQLNLLNRSSELVAGYLGTTGEPSMTVWGDAVNMGEDMQRLVSEIDLVDASGQRSRLLHRDESSLVYPTSAWVGIQPTRAVETGRPEVWWTSSHLGHERTTSPLWHLRVWPLPSSAYSLSAKILSFPPFLTFEDLYTARNLPITVQEESLLKSLIAPGFKTSAFLAKHIVKSDLDTDADRARDRLADMFSMPHHSTPNRVGTKRGF